MFTEKDGTTINNEDKRILNEKKCQNLLNFVTFKELYEKSVFLKIVAQASESGNFLNIFLIFGIFDARFLIKIFLIKKPVYLILLFH